MLLPVPPEDRALFWWRTLCVLAIVNICLWLVVWWLVPIDDSYAAMQITLSGVYVLVCAYRSVLPRVDLERLILVDSRLSSIFLGRSAATVAEICFGIQLALLVHQLAAHAGIPWIQSASWVIPVFMAVAQVFCWHSVLTLNHITQAVESGLWAAGFTWMAALLSVIALATNGVVQMVASTGIAVSLVFVLYVVGVDIPMYVRRFRDGRSAGQQFLTIAHGARDAIERRHANQSWGKWRADAAWLTPYFSAGVWFSISLALVPAP